MDVADLQVGVEVVRRNDRQVEDNAAAVAAEVPRDAGFNRRNLYAKKVLNGDGGEA